MSNNGTQTKALKAGTWYIICNFLLKGLSVITTPIFTRMLATEDYGIVSTYNSYVSFFTIIATLDLYSCVQISKQDWQDDNDKFVCSVLVLSSISAIIFCGIINVVCFFFPDILGIPRTLAAIMLLEILFANAFTLMQTQHRAYLRYKQVVALTLLQSIGGTLLSIILVLLMSRSQYLGRIAGTLIMTVAVGIYAAASIIRRGNFVYAKKEYWKYALSFSIPLIPHHLSGNILSNFDRIMINQFWGASEAGVYNLGYSCGSTIQLFWSSFNGAWTPWFYDAMKKEAYADIKKAVKPYAIIFSTLVLAMIAAAPELIKILGPEAYWKSKWVVPPVVLGIFCQFLYSLYVNVEFYYKKTKIIAMSTVIAAVVNILLNLIFIPVFGYVAAAYTTLAGYMLLFFIHYKVAGKLVPFDLYNRRFIFKMVLFVCLFTIVLMCLYNHFLIRAGFILVIFIGIFMIYKNDILNILNGFLKRR